MMKRKDSLIILLLTSSIALGCIGQEKISFGFYANNHFENSFMPDYSGNIELSYLTTFGYSTFGLGTSIGYYLFPPIETNNSIIQHYSVPIELILSKSFPLKQFDIELNGTIGFHFLNGEGTFLQDVGPDWSGHVYHKGDKYGNPFLGPGGIYGFSILLSKRIELFDIGLRCGYKYLTKSIGFATDVYNPGAINGGFNIGIQTSIWFGQYVKRKGR